MEKLKIGDLTLLLAILEKSRGSAWTLDKISPGIDSPKEAIDTLLHNLKQLQSHQDSLQLDSVLRNQLYQFVEQIQQGKADLRPNAIYSTLGMLLGSVFENLKRRNFLFVPAERAKFYQNVDLFGFSAYVFIEAANDMLDAGNCYSADLYTACVFHLMRVSEFGLRAIALKLRVSLKDKGKPCPIEHATWNKVLDSTEARIRVIRALPSGAKKNEQLIFYSDVASHCRHIRDIWRNEVSHTRTRYNEFEALASMNRVASFMELLATGLYGKNELQKRVLRNVLPKIREAQRNYMNSEKERFDEAINKILKVPPRVVKSAMDQEKADRTAVRSFGVELALDFSGLQEQIQELKPLLELEAFDEFRSCFVDMLLHLSSDILLGEQPTAVLTGGRKRLLHSCAFGVDYDHMLSALRTGERDAVRHALDTLRAERAYVGSEQRWS